MKTIKKFKGKLKGWYPKEFIMWFTGKDSPVAILYGNQAKRFAIKNKYYTIPELFQYWKDKIGDNH